MGEGEEEREEREETKGEGEESRHTVASETFFPLSINPRLD
jgi:hypothetical protein